VPMLKLVVVYVLYFEIGMLNEGRIFELRIIQGAANKSNPLPCFVNISTTNRNFYKKTYPAICHLYLRIIAELY